MQFFVVAMTAVFARVCVARAPQHSVRAAEMLFSDVHILKRRTLL